MFADPIRATGNPALDDILRAKVLELAGTSADCTHVVVNLARFQCGFG